MRIILIVNFLLLYSFTSFGQNAIQKDLLEGINSIRTAGVQCGKKYMKPTVPLTWNTSLYKAAYGHAKDMNDKDFFDHINPAGKDCHHRISDVGYYWSDCGENIAKSEGDYKKVIQLWRNSVKHCILMMNPLLDEMGGAQYKDYWVIDFGSTKNFSK